MKIDQLEHFLLGNSYVVRLTTDSGISGIGTSACWGYPEAVERVVAIFKEYLIGQNPLRIEHHWQHLYRMAPFRGTTLCGAVSAIDIALYDIKGKHFQVPVWELLGGNCRDKIRLHLLAGGPTPEAMYDNAKAAVAEGFTAIKFDPLTGGYQNQAQSRLIQNAVEIVAAAREGAGPDVDLIVEVHRKLTPMVAIALGNALTPLSPLLYGRPHSDRHHHHPSRHCQTHARSLGQWRAFYHDMGISRTLGTRRPAICAPRCGVGRRPDPLQKNRRHSRILSLRGGHAQFSQPLGQPPASVHLDASIPNFITQEYSKNDEREHNAVYKCAHKREGGYIPLPEAPGIGVELDHAKIPDAPFAPLTRVHTPLRADGSIAYAV